VSQFGRCGRHQKPKGRRRIPSYKRYGGSSIVSSHG
jgi:hypothetical protein